MGLIGNIAKEEIKYIHSLSVDKNIGDDISEPLEVTIKDGQFDHTKIVEYKGEDFKKFEFRPQNFSQFIGQEKAKERCKTIIKKVNKGLKSHILIDGIKGHGKTTMVKLLANELNAKLIDRIGNQINIDNITNIINEINQSKEKTVILFIDEIDTMDWKILKNFNPIIESFEVAGKRIKPFIFAGATINKHILIKNNPDTLDRIATHIKFVKYNASEIKQILEQYREKLYRKENIQNEVIDVISKNCKYNPRSAIGLLEEYIAEENIKNVLSNCHIIKDGLTEKDIQILNVLNNSKRAIGCNALALKIGMSQKEYEQEYEPFLLEYDYINRVPSRVITEKGKEFLKII